jgi:hypothetical protein
MIKRTSPLIDIIFKQQKWQQRETDDNQDHGLDQA